jgi:hypothetical protein
MRKRRWNIDPGAIGCGTVIVIVIVAVLFGFHMDMCSEITGDEYEHLAPWADTDLKDAIQDAYADGKVSKWEYGSLCYKMEIHNSNVQKQKALKKFEKALK